MLMSLRRNGRLFQQNWPQTEVADENANARAMSPARALQAIIRARRIGARCWTGLQAHHRQFRYIQSTDACGRPSDVAHGDASHPLQLSAHGKQCKILLATEMVCSCCAICTIRASHRLKALLHTSVRMGPSRSSQPPLLAPGPGCIGPIFSRRVGYPTK